MVLPLPRSAATPTHRPHEQHAGDHTKKVGAKGGVGMGDKEEAAEKTLKTIPSGLVLVVEPARVGATFQVSS